MVPLFHSSMRARWCEQTNEHEPVAPDGQPSRRIDVRRRAAVSTKPFYAQYEINKIILITMLQPKRASTSTSALPSSRCDALFERSTTIFEFLAWCLPKSTTCRFVHRKLTTVDYPTTIDICGGEKIHPRAGTMLVRTSKAFDETNVGLERLEHQY